MVTHQTEFERYSYLCDQLAIEDTERMDIPEFYEQGPRKREAAIENLIARIKVKQDALRKRHLEQARELQARQRLNHVWGEFA